MIVAMIAVRVVEVTVHEVVDVIAVRNGRMPTARTVDMVRIVALAVVLGATVRVCVRDFDDVLVVVVFMGAMQVPVVQVTDMVAVLDRDMPAVGAVLVVVVFVDLVAHRLFSCLSGFES